MDNSRHPSRSGKTGEVVYEPMPRIGVCLNFSLCYWVISRPRISFIKRPFARFGRNGTDACCRTEQDGDPTHPPWIAAAGSGAALGRAVPGGPAAAGVADDRIRRGGGPAGLDG